MSYNYFVEYTPLNATANTIAPNNLRWNGIRYIRIQWVDLTNTTRFRIVPMSYFQKLLQSNRPGVCIAKACFGLVDLVMPPDFEPMGEYLYVLDITTLRSCPYAPGHASVLGWFQEKAPVEQENGNLDVKVDLCPRTILNRVVKEAKTESNVDFLVGFETEFILLTSTEPVEAVNYHAWTTSEGFPSGHAETLALEEIADAIQNSGIELQMYHAEAAPGQYEIITGPLLPLEAADALVHTREIIRNIAVKHGLRATFAPRVYMTSAGSAAHAHISIHSSTETKPSQGLSPYESSFLAGVLDHIRALAALTLPIPASYKRVVDGTWSGGTYVHWGTENRESPIRLTNSTSPTGRRFEMRFVDATANPHLVLASILAAGHAGIKSKRTLDMKDCPGPKAAAQMSETERRALGITQRMPLSWGEARRYFEQDELVRRTFGEEFVTKYLSVNRLLACQLDLEIGESEKLARLIKFY
ncbi:hypothetical protein AX15_000530 [Amanita polypyramis BW_CC]|nr:hypothetical protein AX15_000530 [Amanita polypyramis BW_CC]